MVWGTDSRKAGVMDMRTKVVLIGGNATLIDTFFRQMDEYYEPMCSSDYFEDMERHLMLYDPKLVICCMSDKEQLQLFSSVAQLKKMRSDRDTYYVVMGKEANCDEFQKKTTCVADLEITVPCPTEKIVKTLSDFLSEKEKEEAENGKYKVPPVTSAYKPPARDKSGGDPLDSILTHISSAPSAPTASASGKKHILVIDDDPLMLKVIKDHLHDEYDVASAKGGPTAYKFLEKRKTDLVLLDYEMPDENGPTVFAKIRKMPNGAKVPIIFLTGVSDRERIEEVLKLRPSGYVLKPVDRKILVMAVKKALG